MFKFTLVTPLTVLFKYLLNLGKYPLQWKFAHITPVFRKGLSSDVSNYRPISLTSVFGKFLERMLDYLLINKLISPMGVDPGGWGMHPLEKCEGITYPLQVGLPPAKNTKFVVTTWDTG